MQERAGEKIAELLINNGADINQEDIKKSTPCEEAGNFKKPNYLKYNFETFHSEKIQDFIICFSQVRQA